jgi:GxxExxY protein
MIGINRMLILQLLHTKYKTMPGFKHSDITEKIIGAPFKVHSTLGNGFQEVIYQRALAIEMGVAKLNFMREFEMPIFYLGQHIGTRRVDFLVEEIINVELKAIIKLEDVHLAQAINYLEAYNLEIGLLINLGSKRLEFHRFTNKKYTPSLKHSILSNLSNQSQKS